MSYLNRRRRKTNVSSNGLVLDVLSVFTHLGFFWFELSVLCAESVLLFKRMSIIHAGHLADRFIHGAESGILDLNLPLGFVPPYHFQNFVVLSSL